MDSDALDAARRLLPLWVPWVSVVFLPAAAFALLWVLMRVLVFLATPAAVRGADLHWSERARLLWGPRVMVNAMAIALPFLAGFIAYDNAGPLLYVSAGALGLLTALAGLAAALSLRWRHENAARRLSWSSALWLRSLATALLVLLPHFALILALAPLMPAHLSWTTAAIALVVLPLVLFLAAGGGVLIALRLGLATEAPERVRAIVARTATEVGSAPRGVLVLPLASANAYAFPLWGRIAFTPGAIEQLSDDELGAVCAHELGHLSESHELHWKRAVTVVFLVAPLIFVRPLLNDHGPLVVLTPMVLAILALQRLARRSRTNEERADHVAHAHERHEGVYARALARLYESNVVPAVMAGKSMVHPHLYDRMVKAGVDPGFARPQPPSLKRAYLALGVVVGLACAAPIAFVSVMRGVNANSEAGDLRAVALSGGGDDSLSRLSYAHYARGDFAGAIVLCHAHSVVDTRRVYPAANLAIMLAYAGRCAESARALDDARVRLGASASPHDLRLIREAQAALSRCPRGG